MFHIENALWWLTSVTFFDKLPALVLHLGAKHCMAENSLHFSAIADNLEQVGRLVDAGKLESGL